MDSTGSMGSYIHSATQHIRSIVEKIVESEKSNVRLALIEYRDHPPQVNRIILVILFDTFVMFRKSKV
jgi:hypothetical protein